MRLHIAAAIVCLATGGCTTYPYAKDVKMVSFDNDVTEGHGVGPIRGESCQELILGIPINEAPSLDAAFADTRQDAGRLRYLNNVSTDATGFDAVVYAKRCLVVKATGYK